MALEHWLACGGTFPLVCWKSTNVAHAVSTFLFYRSAVESQELQKLNEATKQTNRLLIYC